MPTTITHVYRVPRNLQRQTEQEKNVAGLASLLGPAWAYDNGELDFFHLTETSDTTTTVGNNVERTIVWEAAAEFDVEYPTQEAKEAAAASILPTAVFELRCTSATLVTLTSTVVP